jgi:hypothetical protein
MRTALTANELTVLRSPKQWSRLYVAVHRPQTLFSARLTAAPTTWPAATLAFSSGTPGSGTVPAHATIYIGTSAGARDKGTLRLRSALTKAASGSMDIAELGEKALNLAANDYLTVVEDYRPAAKFPRYSSAWYMDYGVAYDPVTIQNDNYGPLARLGPAAVGFLVGGHCHLKYVGERSAAYSPSNAIDTWAWVFPNATTSASQGTTASPVDVDYTAAIPDGQYHSLTVTEDVTNKTHVGRRLTFVFERTGANAPYDAAIVGRVSGGPQQGGYTADLRILNTTANQANFSTGAHVVIFTEDHYATDAGEYWRLSGATGTFTVARVVTGATSGATGTIAALLSTTFMQIKVTSGEFIPGESITEATSEYTATIDCPNIGGNYPDRGNVLIEGWIMSEVVRKNPLIGEVEFTIGTLDAMLKTIEGYPVALTNRSTTATLSWEDYKRTTMNTATLHFVLWRSTIGDIADVEFQGYGPPHTAIMKYVDMDKASLFDQLNGYWQRTMLGWAACDMQGALYCEMDAVIDETIRAQLTTIWTVDKDQDLRDDLEIQPAVVEANSQTVLYAVAYRKPLGARSPDDPHGYQGFTQETTEGVAGPLVGGDVTQPDQATLNVWAGNLRAKANNVYPNVPHQLFGNWRIDPVPQCYFVESFASGDTLRGFTLTSQKWIPRFLQMMFNKKSWSLLSEVAADAETIGIGGATITFTDVDPPDDPIYPPAPTDPPTDPGLSADAKELWMATTSAGNGAVDAIYASFDALNGGQPTFYQIATPGNNVVYDFLMASDGSMAYLHESNHDDGTVDAIYKLTNIATIRATPATAPDWDVIIQRGDAITGGTIQPSFGWCFADCWIYRNLLCIVARSSDGNYYYAEYDGTTLGSWSILPGATYKTSLHYGHVYRGQMYTGYGTQYYWDLRAIPGGTAIGSSFYDDVGTLGAILYQNDLSTNYAAFWDRYSNYYIVNLLLNKTYTDSIGRHKSRLTGALRGMHLYTIDSNGKFMVAEDGYSWTRPCDTVYDWGGDGNYPMGMIKDAQLAGGGSLLWLRGGSQNGQAVAESNEFLRISNDHGRTFPTALTGNFWSLTSGDQIFVNMHLVFNDV